MDTDKLITELERYESNISGILSRFSKSSSGLFISRDDARPLKQFVIELSDLFADIGDNNVYATNVINTYNSSANNFYASPSYNGVEGILSVVSAAITRYKRDSKRINIDQSNNMTQKNNIFIIHGQEEAKWRELKDILKSQFNLNPIILQEQTSSGATTIIEKFEHYASTCGYAIAIYTPDDVVSSNETTYQQARPNVIWELGWFCGRIGRKNTILLLKENTSMFSDFNGIEQIRFINNITEVTKRIRSELITAGIISNS